ncbi:MAG: shikimate kinase [Bryobacteraceae bacterium]|nr:shikimate kinase [Bryobacteraceae bacterium]MCX7603120.1 shikimate kinase [Bryobacteraceae bacterium]
MILKLKRTPGIYLVGFMGCGKTTVGRMLARRLGWRFADLDEDIEARAQMPITEIFERFGEEEFRQMEHEALRRRIADIARGVPWVVAVGGGCFAQPRNYELISNNGISIWLDAPLEMLRARVAQSTTRPLARDPAKFEELYHARRPAYEKADYRIEIGPGGSAEAVEDILRLPIF